MMNPFLYLRIRRLFNDSTHEAVFRGKWIMSRDYIIRELKEIGPPAVKVISKKLRSRNSGRRLHAAYLLGEFGSPLAVPPLIEALNSDDCELSCAAAIALGKIRDKRATPELLNQFERGGLQLSLDCAHALGEIGDASAIPRMVGLMRFASKRESAADFANQLAEALKKLGPPPASCVPTLLELGAYGNFSCLSSKEVAAYVRWALPRMEESAIPMLVSALAQENFPLPEGQAYCAREALLGKGASAVSELVLAVENKGNPQILREDSIRILGRIKDPSAVGALASALKEERMSTRMAAAKALGKIGDSSAISPLLECIKCERGGDLRDALAELLQAPSDGGQQVRLAAAASLSMMHPRSPRDLLLLHKAIVAVTGLVRGEDAKADGGPSLRKIYEKWAMQLSQLAAEKHKNSKLQIPPRLRKPPAHMRRREDICRRMVAGRRA